MFQIAQRAGFIPTPHAERDFLRWHKQLWQFVEYVGTKFGEAPYHLPAHFDWTSPHPQQINFNKPHGQLPRHKRHVVSILGAGQQQFSQSRLVPLWHRHAEHQHVFVGGSNTFSQVDAEVCGTEGCGKNRPQRPRFL